MAYEPFKAPGSASGSLFKRLGMIAGLLFLGLLIGFYISATPGSDAPQRFSLLPGSSARNVANELYAAGLIQHPVLFRVWVKLYGSRGAPRPGIYMLSYDRLGFRIFQQLRKGPPLVRITFPEGWTSKQMAELLEKRGVTSGAGFLAVVEKDKREGFLFPDTYFFDQGQNPQVVVDRMIKRFHEAEPKDMMTQAKVLNLSYRQIVILASLVEREARVPDERPIIAAVFLNRLKKRWRLESCATVEYALGGWKRRLSYKDLEVNSPFNTYRHFGLPPGPICNPGKAALEAAAHPAATDVMFFVAEGDGTHQFSRYYKDHLDAKKRPKK
jgi:UPF0755 protein